MPSKKVRDSSAVVQRLLGRSMWHMAVSSITGTLACLMIFLVFIYLGYLIFWTKNLDVDPSLDWKSQLISQSGRIVVIAIMIFLAQSLLSMHRYCVRLSEHYFTRAYAILVAPRGQMEDLETAVRAFDANQIVHKGVPESPFQDIGRLFGKLRFGQKEGSG